MSELSAGHFGPLREASIHPGLEPDVGYPVQASKVQLPVVRDDTLARPRLLDWLQAKIHSRLVLVTAEAGYGKTTLLADFSRRTRTRVLWYRLDETDRGWAPFLAHLVAGGQRTDREFGQLTLRLLQEQGPNGPSREEVLGALIRELGGLSGSGLAVVLDDFHLVDDADEVVGAVKELLHRAPERLTLVISSRRRPSLPIARLRTLGEVAELTGADLRFDESETDQLFRETYGCPLDRETVAELTQRTEGWAASLHLVQAAIRGRTARETRAFIRSLTGAEAGLYDYLAEEVVGHLPEDLQQFIMRASILESVEPELAAIAADIDVDQARSLIATAERYGLLSRTSSQLRVASRFHPLVREFLTSRLSRDESPLTLARRHEAVARFAENDSWHIACAHFQAAGLSEQVSRVLGRALPLIMATGQYELASRFAKSSDEDAVSSLVLSRLALSRDDVAVAIRHARAAVTLSSSDEHSLGNLIAVLVGAGEFDEARTLAAQLKVDTRDPQLSAIAELTIGLIESSVDGDLVEHLQAALSLAGLSNTAGWTRYEGIALLNAAELLRAIGDAQRVLDIAKRAQEVLESTDSQPELATVCSIRGWARARLGDLAGARRELIEARGRARGDVLVETLAEFAESEALFGDSRQAELLLDEAESVGRLSIEHQEKVDLVRVQLEIRKGRFQEASERLGRVRAGAFSGVPGREAWRKALDAHLALSVGAATLQQQIESALQFAQSQGARRWMSYCVALRCCTQPGTDLSDCIVSLGAADRGALGPLTELLVGRLEDLDEPAFHVIQSEALVRPERWGPTLRRAIEGATAKSRSAKLLEQVGQLEDVPALRRLGRLAPAGSPDRDLGRRLARRLAPRVYVEDQGRVAILMAGEAIAARSIRRKVLALVCFLITKPMFTSSRDEILDALWPDMDPQDALNSLNQTLYFLRRVFEPNFADELSPGYVHHDSEIVWLDRELVDSRSASFARLVARVAHPPTPGEVSEITTTYRGKFAVDFAYEEWSSAYRDTNHAAYLQIVEEGLRSDIESGNLQRGVDVARLAIAVDPTAYQIEHALLRLYKLQGAHAAASEQYAHYAAQYRADLDADPPPLEAI